MLAFGLTAGLASLIGAGRPRRLNVTRRSTSWHFSKLVEADSQVTLLSTFRGRSDRRKWSISSRVSGVDASIVVEEGGDEREDGRFFCDQPLRGI